MYTKRERPLAMLLKGAVKALSTLLLLLGLAMMGYSGWLAYLAWFPHNGLSFGEWKGPWFMYAFGGFGALIFLTAFTGLTGSRWGNTTCLDLHKLLLLVLLTAEGALAVVIFSDNLDVEKLLPDDPEYSKAKAFYKENEEIMEWAMLLLVVIQVCSLLLACTVSAIIDLDNESDAFEEGISPYAPLAPAPTTSRQLSSGNGSPLIDNTTPRNDPWSRRMRERYNLNTSAFSYDPESGQHPPAPYATEPPPEKAGGCAIM